MSEQIKIPPSNPRCKALKIQEIYAHSELVNTACIGQQSCAVFATGGDDLRVNVWKIGRNQPVMSFVGHTTEVDSVTFDPSESFVCAGSRGGTIKLWDCSSEKVIRTLSGHRSSAVALDFHPFGDFLASGALDCNVKVWDIKKKGCMQTYKGHQSRITVIRHSPDGKWIVSGDTEGIAKVWDLTAGKLVKEFRLPKSEITSVTFHPNEFLLAISNLHQVVIYDMETFECISTTSKEANSIRQIAFSPDGRALLAAQTDSLRIWGWEPTTCYDSIDVNWTGLCGVAISEKNEFIGVSKNKTLVSVHLIDLPFAAPFNQPLDGSSSNGDHSLLNKNINNPNPTFANNNSNNLNPTKSPPSEAPVSTKSISSRTYQESNTNETDSTSSLSTNISKAGDNASATPSSHSRWPAASAFTRPTVQQQHVSSSSISSESNSQNQSKSSSPRESSSNSSSPRLPSTDAMLTPKRSILASPNNAFFKAHAKESPIVVAPPASLQPSSISSAIDFSIASTPATHPILLVNENVKKPSWPLQSPVPAPSSSSVASSFSIKDSVHGNNGTPSIHSWPNNQLSTSPINKLAEEKERITAPVPPETTPSTASLTPVPLFTATATTTTSPGSTLIPAQPNDKPLGLNVNAFLAASPSSSDNEVYRQKLLAEHTLMRQILTQRLSHFRVLRSFWTKGDLRGFIEYLNSVHDLAIVVDCFAQFLHVDSLVTNSKGDQEVAVKRSFEALLRSQPLGFLTLEYAVEFLQFCEQLCNSAFERYVDIGMQMIFIVVEMFGQIILQNKNLSIESRTNMDLMREERIQRSQTAYESITRSFQSLQKYMKKSNEIGAKTREVSRKLNERLGLSQ